MADFIPVVHKYEETLGGFIVNAFFVETANGVVAVDSGLAMSEIKAMRSLIKDSIGKDLLGVLLTHGHPDHYTGAAELIKGYGDIPVVATQATVDQCKSRDEEESGYLGSENAFGPEYPTDRMFPNDIVTSGDSRTFDDVTFTCEDLGPCESDDDVTWSLDIGGVPHVFTGDIAYNHMHTFFRDGHFTHWIEQLDYCIGTYDHRTVMHSGHGEDMGVEILHWAKGYNLAFRQVLKSILGDRDTLNEDEQKVLFGTMMRYCQTDKLLMLTGWQFDDMIKALRADGAL